MGHDYDIYFPEKGVWTLITVPKNWLRNMLTIPNSPRYNAVFWSKFFSPSYFSTFQEAINLSFHFESEFDFFTNQNEKQQIFELRILKYHYSDKK